MANIQELISLVRGCDMSGCGVTDPGCLADSCASGCTDCTDGLGPGQSGCYWDPALDPSGCGQCYSSSSYLDGSPGTNYLWGVYYGTAHVGQDAETNLDCCFRCVRTMALGFNPFPETQNLLSENFADPLLNTSLWAIYDFTTEHLGQKDITIENEQVRLDTRSTAFAWTEESAIRTVTPVDVSAGPIVIEYDHIQAVSFGIAEWWPSFLALSDDPANTNFIVGSGVNTVANYSGKQNVLLIGYRPNGEVIAVSRVGDTGVIDLTSPYCEFSTTGDQQIYFYIDETNMYLAMGGVERFAGPHGFPTDQPLYLFFGNYADQNILHTAWFDNVLISQ